jgi:hypothetical protein
MPQTDVLKTTTTGLKGTVLDFSVSPQAIESPEEQDENYYYNDKFATWHGYYRTLPEANSNLDALATWSVGKGWEADATTTVRLERITGNGKQSFQQIMKNHLIIKKLNGDSYTQIIRNEKGSLINLKVLNPARIVVVYGKDGRIKRYDQLDSKLKGTLRKFKPEEILHSMNNPVGDEMHGISVFEPAQWAIDAKQEAMRDWRRISHRSTIRVLYVDIDDTAQITKIRNQYAEGIKQGEVLILPVKKGDAEFEDLSLPPVQAFLEWIRYLDNFIYQALKVPKIITGGTQEHTEASSKVGYLTFDPVYTQEQLELEADLWNQVAIKVDFKRPAEFGGTMNEDEQKNTGQVGFQPNETQVTAGRRE